LPFKTEMGSVYCEVRTESLYNTDSVFLIRVNIPVLVVLKSRVSLCKTQVSCVQVNLVFPMW
jgi:hypothetical protein